MEIYNMWLNIENGKKVHWHHEDYEVIPEEANKENEFQMNHFSYKNGNVLVIRHRSGHQAIIARSELIHVYTN